LPEGRIIEIFGPEASGKTTLTLHFIAAAQRRGYLVYFIDAEHALDIDYAERIGVDTQKLLFSQPDYGEQALDTARAICDSTIEASEKFGKQLKSLIVIDSVPALIPKEAFETYESDKESGLESSIALGGVARMMAKLLPPLLNKVSKSGVTLVFINQERDNIGVTYGSPTTTPGGRALKYFSSLRLKVQRIGYYQRGDEKLGIRTQMIPVKSKLFPIFGRRAEFIIGNTGISKVLAIVETLLSKGIVAKSGAWLSINGKKFQGVPALEEELNTNKAFLDEMEQLIASRGGQSKPLELKPKVTDLGVQNPGVVSETT
jgi:recombination protein RecA